MPFIFSMLEAKTRESTDVFCLNYVFFYLLDLPLKIVVLLHDILHIYGVHVFVTCIEYAMIKSGYL